MIIGKKRFIGVVLANGESPLQKAELIDTRPSVDILHSLRHVGSTSVKFKDDELEGDLLINFSNVAAVAIGTINEEADD